MDLNKSNVERIGNIPICIEEYEMLLYENIREQLTSDNKILHHLTRSANEHVINKLNLFYHDSRFTKIIILAGRVYCEECWDTRKDFFFEMKKRNNHSKRYWDSVECSYNKVAQIPVWYIYESIGMGEHGLIVKNTDNKVEKIWYSNLSNVECVFYTYLKTNHMTIFPRVYYVSTDRVIMEKLKVGLMSTHELLPYITYIDKFVKVRNDLFGFREKYVDWDELSQYLGEYHWFYQYLKEIEKGLNTILGVISIGDLSSSNIGFRSNGDVVYFDPIYKALEYNMGVL